MFAFVTNLLPACSVLPNSALLTKVQHKFHNNFMKDNFLFEKIYISFFFFKLTPLLKIKKKSFYSLGSEILLPSRLR